MTAVLALSAVLASQEARSRTSWVATVSSDSMMVQGSEEAGARVARELGAVGYGPDRWAYGPDGSWGYGIVLPLPAPFADPVPRAPLLSKVGLVARDTATPCPDATSSLLVHARTGSGSGHTDGSTLL